MSEPLLDPEFLRLAAKAQAAFAKASRMDDGDALEGQFCVHDMLDILGREMDAAPDTAEKE